MIMGSNHQTTNSESSNFFSAYVFRYHYLFFNRLPKKKMFCTNKNFGFFFKLRKNWGKLWGNKISCLVFGPGICVIYFISFPQKKNCHQRKLRQTKCLLFNFWAVKLTQVSDTHFAKSSMQVPNVFLVQL